MKRRYLRYLVQAMCKPKYSKGFNKYFLQYLQPGDKTMKSQYF